MAQTNNALPTLKPKDDKHNIFTAWLASRGKYKANLAISPNGEPFLKLWGAMRSEVEASLKRGKLWDVAASLQEHQT